MKFTKSEKALYRHAIRWFLDKEKLSHVKVALTPLHKAFFFGLTNHLDAYEFDIELNPGVECPFTKLQVLFHELIHVKQFAQGRLASTSDGWFWLGDDMTDVGYEEQPWEIEANAAEKYLTELYLAQEW